MRPVNEGRHLNPGFLNITSRSPRHSLDTELHQSQVVSAPPSVNADNPSSSGSRRRNITRGFGKGCFFHFHCFFTRNVPRTLIYVTICKSSLGSSHPTLQRHRARRRTQAHAGRQAPMRTQPHTQARTHKHTCAWTCTDVCMHGHMHAQARVSVHVHIHSHVCARVHTCTCVHTHARAKAKADERLPKAKPFSGQGHSVPLPVPLCDPPVVRMPPSSLAPSAQVHRVRART